MMSTHSSATHVVNVGSLLICLSLLPTFLRADEIEQLRQFIKDGINSNLAATRALDVTVEEKERSSFATQGSRLRDRVINKSIAFDGVRWRQSIVTTILGPRNRTLPYQSDSVFDGDTTLRFSPDERSATRSGGNEMESIPSKDLCYGYTFWDWPLPQTLRFATAIAQRQADDKGAPRALFDITLPATRPPRHVTTLSLDPAAGFLIVAARGEDESGRIVRERRGTVTKKVAGTWLLIAGEDEMWEYRNGTKQTTEHRAWRVSVNSVNEPIPQDTFNIELPSNTLLVDKVTGKTVVTGPTVASRASRKWPRSWMIAINIVTALVVAVAVWCWRFRAAE
jgi:hypothetical protein